MLSPLSITTLRSRHRLVSPQAREVTFDQKGVGEFRIQGAPPGEYEITVWCESLTAQTGKLKAAARGKVDFTFDAAQVYHAKAIVSVAGVELALNCESRLECNVWQ